MTLGPLALALALNLSPPAAARFALLTLGVEPELMDGRRDLGEQLERIAHRESIGGRGPRETEAAAWSRAHRVGIHVRDAASSRRVWRKMVGRGELDPGCQPYEPGAWATRGPWGLVAAKKYLEQCEPAPRPRRGWCKRT